MQRQGSLPYNEVTQWFGDWCFPPKGSGSVMVVYTKRYKQTIKIKVTYTTMHSDNIFNFIINFNFQNLLNLCLLPLDANNGKTVYNDVL